jgi:hypothetical protein
LANTFRPSKTGESIRMPHVIFGLAEVGAAIFTQTRPSPVARSAARLGASA